MWSCEMVNEKKAKTLCGERYRKNGKTLQQQQPFFLNLIIFILLSNKTYNFWSH